MRVALALALLALIGCDKKKEAAKEPPKPVAIDAAPAPPKAPDAAPAPPAPPDAAPAPATKTKVVDFDDIGQDQAFQLDVPEGAQIEQTEFTEESFPRGYIRWAEIEIEVMRPESEPGTLEEDTAGILRGTGEPKVEVGEADADGYTMIYSQNAYGTTTREWSVSVSRPAWEVTCGAYQLKTRADADAAATVCRSIRKPAK